MIECLAGPLVGIEPKVRALVWFFLSSIASLATVFFFDLFISRALGSIQISGQIVDYWIGTYLICVITVMPSDIR